MKLKPAQVFGRGGQGHDAVAVSNSFLLSNANKVNLMSHTATC